MDTVMRLMQHGACDDPETHAGVRRRTAGGKPGIPKALSLTVRILPHRPRPLDDGRWQFDCSFPRLGSPDVLIVAEDAKTAKAVLEEFLYNALDGNDSLEDR